MTFEDIEPTGPKPFRRPPVTKEKSPVELKRLVGHFRDPRTGEIKLAGWDMDQLILNGRQIATINRVPGAPVGLFAGVHLSPKETKLVEDAIAEKRGGVRPSKIQAPIQLPFELLDEDESEDSDD